MMKRKWNGHAGIALAVAGALALGGFGAALAAAPQEAHAATPAKVTLASVKGGVKKLTVKVRKAKGAKGYQYQATWRKTWGTPMSKRTSKLSCTFKGLGEGTWRARVRAWAKTGGKVKWGKWSSVGRCEVTAGKPSGTSGGTSGPSSGGSSTEWVESTPGWDLDYPYEVKIVNKVRSGDAVKVFLETDAPADYMKRVRVYIGKKSDSDRASRTYSVTGGFGMYDEDFSTYFADLHSLDVITADEAATTSDAAQNRALWVKVDGGYVTAVNGGCVSVDKKTPYNLYVSRVPAGVQYESFDGYYHVGYPPHKNIGSFYAYPDPYESGEFDAMLDDIIDRAVTDRSASKGDQMDQVVTWLMDHSRYPDSVKGRVYSADGQSWTYYGGTVALFSDRWMSGVDRYAVGEQLKLDSLGGPMLVKELGEKMGYELVGQAQVPESVGGPGGRSLKQDLHSWLCNVEDGRWWNCQPPDRENIWASVDDVPVFEPSAVAQWETALG